MWEGKGSHTWAASLNCVSRCYLPSFLCIGNFKPGLGKRVFKEVIIHSPREPAGESLRLWSRSCPSPSAHASSYMLDLVCVIGSVYPGKQKHQWIDVLDLFWILWNLKAHPPIGAQSHASSSQQFTNWSIQTQEPMGAIPPHSTPWSS